MRRSTLQDLCSGTASSSESSSGSETELRWVLHKFSDDVLKLRATLREKETLISPLREQVLPQRALKLELDSEIHSLEEDSDLYYIFWVYGQILSELEDEKGKISEFFFSPEDWMCVRRFLLRRNDYFHHPLDRADGLADRAKLREHAHRLPVFGIKVLRRVMDRVRPLSIPESSSHQGTKRNSPRETTECGESSSKRIRSGSAGAISVMYQTLSQRIKALQDEAKSLDLKTSTSEKEWIDLAEDAATLPAIVKALKIRLSALRQAQDWRTIYRVFGEYLHKFLIQVVRSRNVTYKVMIHRLKIERESNPEAYLTEPEHTNLLIYLKSVGMSMKAWDFSLDFVDQRDNFSHVRVLQGRDWERELQILNLLSGRLQGREKQLITKAIAWIRKR